MSSEKQIFQMREADYPFEGLSELRSLPGTQADDCRVDFGLGLNIFARNPLACQTVPALFFGDFFERIFSFNQMVPFYFLVFQLTKRRC